VSQIAFLQACPHQVSYLNQYQQPTRICAFEKALKFLQMVSSKLCITQEITFQRTILKILFQWSLARNELLRAHSYQDLHQSLSSLQVDVSSFLEGQLAKVNLLVRQERAQDALNLLRYLLDVSNQYTLLHFKARCLLLSAEVKFISAPDTPFLSLPPLLECIAICQNSAYDSILPEANIVLCGIYTCMMRYDEANLLFENILPHILEHSNAFVQGKCYLEMAKNSLAQYDQKIGRQYEKQYNNAIECLNKSICAFEIAEDVVFLQEAWYLKARIFNTIGNIKGREESANRCLYYCELKKLGMTKQIESINILGEDVSANLGELLRMRANEYSLGRN